MLIVVGKYSNPLQKTQAKEKHGKTAGRAASYIAAARRSVLI